VVWLTGSVTYLNYIITLELLEETEPSLNTFELQESLSGLIIGIWNSTCIITDLVLMNHTFILIGSR
jgi:hypothetical protein